MKMHFFSKESGMPGNNQRNKTFKKLANVQHVFWTLLKLTTAKAFESKMEFSLVCFVT